MKTGEMILQRIEWLESAGAVRASESAVSHVLRNRQYDFGIIGGYDGLETVSAISFESIYLFRSEDTCTEWMFQFYRETRVTLARGIDDEIW